MISSSVFILLGGKSERFGSPKYLTKIHGIPLINKLLHICADFKYVHCVGKEGINSMSDNLLVKDLMDIQAPIIGLYTALKFSKTNWIILLSCDLPLLTEKDLLQLWSYTSKHPEKNIIIPKVNEKWQTTFALYNKNVTDICKTKIMEGKLSIANLISSTNYEVVDMSMSASSLLNMNTKNDLRIAEKILRSKKN